jgi:ferrochelatase
LSGKLPTHILIEMKTAVLLMAHGSPESPDEMEEYLNLVMTKSRPTPEFIREMQARYATFGGKSPLLEITKKQAEALEERLGIPVRVGMRHWRPFIRDVVDGIGCDRIIGIAMAPHFSPVSVGAYHRALGEATDLGLELVSQWHSEPKLLDAWAGRIDTSDNILFSAHAVPTRVSEPYTTQIRETIDGILARLGKRPEWGFAWQSRPNAPGTWTEPDVAEFLLSKGWNSVQVAPIGFVSDHAEVLFDLDHQLRVIAEENGVRFCRTEMLNDDPFLIDALEAVVRRVL